jgi:hypothetical protein
LKRTNPYCWDTSANVNPAINRHLIRHSVLNAVFMAMPSASVLNTSKAMPFVADVLMTC